MSRRKTNAATAPADSAPQEEHVGIQTIPYDEREQGQKVIIEKHEVAEQPLFATMDELEATGQSFTQTVVKGGRECRTMSGILLYRGA